MPFATVDARRAYQRRGRKGVRAKGGIGRNVGIDQHWEGPYQPPTKESRVALMRDRIEHHNAPSAYRFQPHQEGLL